MTVGDTGAIGELVVVIGVFFRQSFSYLAHMLPYLQLYEYFCQSPLASPDSALEAQTLYVLPPMACHL